MNMNLGPKLHHWVPQFYLRNFEANENKKLHQVWILHRKAGDSNLVSISKIAAKNHLYLSDDGTRDLRLEHKLSDLEAAVGPLWQQFEACNVDFGHQQTRKNFALYIAVQFLRHPDRWKTIELAKGHLPPTISAKQVWHRTIEREAVDYAKRLIEKRWSIVCIDEPNFVTSDNPIYVIDQDKKRTSILEQNAILHFPLTSTRFLCMDDFPLPGNRYFKVDSRKADDYNLLTWVNTDGFIMSPRPIENVISGFPYCNPHR